MSLLEEDGDQRCVDSCCSKVVYCVLSGIVDMVCFSYVIRNSDPDHTHCYESSFEYHNQIDMSIDAFEN